VVVANGVWPQLFTAEERAALSKPNHWDERDPGQAALAAGARRAARETMQEESLRRLRETVKAPLHTLPYLFEEVSSLATVRKLAELL
jgi:hypothetical protein